MTAPYGDARPSFLSLSDEAKRLLLDMEARQQVTPLSVYVPSHLPGTASAVRELAVGGYLDAAWRDDGVQVHVGLVLSAAGEDVACFLRDPDELRHRLQGGQHG